MGVPPPPPGLRLTRKSRIENQCYACHENQCQRARESMLRMGLFAAGICNRYFVLRSTLVSFLIKIFSISFHISFYILTKVILLCFSAHWNCQELFQIVMFGKLTSTLPSILLMNLLSGESQTWKASESILSPAPICLFDLTF